MAINNPVITDSDIFQGIAEAIQAKDGGGKMYDTEMRGRIDALQVADPYEIVNKCITGEIQYFKTSSAGAPPFTKIAANDSTATNLFYFSMKNMHGNIYDGIFTRFGANGGGKWIAILGSPTWIQSDVFHNTYLRTLVFLNTSLPTLSGVFINVNISNLKIWVFDSILNNFKTGTNWSAYSDKTKGFSEAPTYDSTTTYSIGDVCKYNNNFYAYAYEGKTSSAGNAPSGTTDDNTYWEYVATIEVI